MPGPNAFYKEIRPGQYDLKLGMGDTPKIRPGQCYQIFLEYQSFQIDPRFQNLQIFLGYQSFQGHQNVQGPKAAKVSKLYKFTRFPETLKVPKYIRNGGDWILNHDMITLII